MGNGPTLLFITHIPGSGVKTECKLRYLFFAFRKYNFDIMILAVAYIMYKCKDNRWKFILQYLVVNFNPLVMCIDAL